MDKQKQIAKVAENDEDRVLFARIYDRLTGAEHKNTPGVTCFLSPREQILTGRMLPHMDIRFFGGSPEAERAMACWLPDYLDETFLYADDGPAAAVRATFRKQDTLTHRDFLGSLMGCGIKRETVGDIYVGEGVCDFLVTREILPFVLDNLTEAGRTKLYLEQIPLNNLQIVQTISKEYKDTVSSLRLDAIVGSAFRMARGKAVALIEAGKVTLNDLPCLKPDKQLSEGDKISARGYGKAILRQVCGITKKNRISILLEVYL